MKRYERHEIMDKLEALEEQVWKEGFLGSNEAELHYQESIADWLMPLIGTKSSQKENFVRVNPEIHGDLS